MAAPTWQSTTVTDFGSDATSHAANCPATVNSGDLLLAVAAFDGLTTTVTTPSGWTQLMGSLSDDPVGGVYAKVAAGSEGGTTVDWVTSNAQRGSVHIVRITGWAGALDRVLVGGGNGGSSGGTACALGLGESLDVLWVYAQIKSSATAWGTLPSGYGNENKTNASEDTSASASIATATKSTTAVTRENPADGWVSTSSALWSLFLVGVAAT